MKAGSNLRMGWFKLWCLVLGIVKMRFFGRLPETNLLIVA
jgi:hypothetical protein